MQNVDISNFKKILTPAQAGTGETFEIKSEELFEALKKLEEKNESLMQKISGEEYIDYFKRYLSHYVEEKTFASFYAVSTVTPFPIIQLPRAETNIDKLLDELNQKNQMIQMLSTSLKVSDKLFARLLNKLSIGFILFFLLTILICYLAFS